MCGEGGVIVNSPPWEKTREALAYQGTPYSQPPPHTLYILICNFKVYYLSVIYYLLCICYLLFIYLSSIMYWVLGNLGPGRLGPSTICRQIGPVKKLNFKKKLFL